MLGYEGFDVKGAENGALGVEQARIYQPDLIICDIMMPVLDGFGVLETLRQDPTTATIPFIFLTARTDRPDMRAGMELGADDYVTKPFTAQELIKTVQTRLEKHETVYEKAQKRIDELRQNIVLALPHELRTPLNVIMGFSDLLVCDAETLEPARITDMAKYINNAAMRLYRLVENYLIYAQLEVALTNPQQANILREGKTENAHLVMEEQAKFRLSTPHPPAEPRQNDATITLESVDTILMTDEYIKKVIEELTDNACKFSDPGTPITVTGQVQGRHYVLIVADQGVGMTQEQIDDIGAYSQFDRKLREQQGSGLGLSIVRRLTELFDGTMSIASAPQQGTKVTVLLPIG
jgi:signal transduction histidine kinase